MVGDAYTQFELVAPSAYLEVKPAAGYEVIIHNIYHAGGVNLKLVDGSGNELDYYDEAGKSVLMGIYMHLTETQYLRVYNLEAGDMRIAVDGIVSVEP